MRQCFHDPANRRKKTHVEHSIGLVEHEKLDARKIGYSLVHQIDQPPRCGYDQIDTGTQRLDLRTFTHAAENRGHAQRNVLRVSANVLLDLHHQLTSRRDHQRARAAVRALRGESSTGLAIASRVMRLRYCLFRFCELH